MARRKMYQVVYVGPYDQEVDRKFEQRLWPNARVARRYGASLVPHRYRRHWLPIEKKHVNSYELLPVIVEASFYPRTLLRSLRAQVRIGGIAKEWINYGFAVLMCAALAGGGMDIFHLSTLANMFYMLGALLSLPIFALAFIPFFRAAAWNARLEQAKELWRIEADVQNAARLNGERLHRGMPNTRRHSFPGD